MANNYIAFEERTKGKLFITDFKSENSSNKSETKRYAVWSPNENGERHEIIELGNDLNELQKKYEIDDEHILIIY
jgi:hypothetical protein